MPPDPHLDPSPNLSPSLPSRIRFWLDDRLVDEGEVLGTTTLLRYLRDHLSQMGTKEGCAEGDCGACSVVILEEREGEEAVYRAVNACLIFLPMLHGKRVYTVQGLREQGADPVAGLHPAQRAMVDHRGSQCGYCTPGIVMSLFEACYREDLPAGPDALDDQLCGNLCRCTGYRPIRDAGKAVAGIRPSDRFMAQARQYQPGPAGLDLRAHAPLHGEQRYLQPEGLSALLAARRDHPEAQLVAGGTDVGLQVTKFHRHLRLVIGLEGVASLRRLEREPGGWWIGASTTLTRLGEVVGAEIPALRKMLRIFGSRQIRSRATVAGNLVNASPIGDLPPVLAALDAQIVAVGLDARGALVRREIPLQAFYTGYRRTALAPYEIVEAIRLKTPSVDTFVSAFKVSKRREMDISTVAAGMAVRLVGERVEEIRLAYGGVSALAAARAHRTEAALRGGPWTLEAVEAAAAHLEQDFQPIDDLRGSSDYRRLLVRNLLLGFYVESVAGDCGADAPLAVGSVHALEAK